jgi:hypothetical protein
MALVSKCDGGITATVEEHVVQWNPVVLRILSWRERREEAKREEFKEKTTKQPLRQVSW